MAQKFKKGQRVQITEGYVGKPTGEIVKYNKELHAYNVKGNDGENYNCISEDSLALLEGITFLKEAPLNAVNNAFIQDTEFVSNSNIYYTPKEVENTISVYGDVLKAGDELSSLLLNGKEIENVEEVKVALNMVVKALNRMVN